MPDKLQELWKAQELAWNIFNSFQLRNSNSIKDEERVQFDLDRKKAEYKWNMAYREYNKALDDAMFAEMQRENDYFKVNMHKPDIDHE
jgi:hypothetical protein